MVDTFDDALDGGLRSPEVHLGDAMSHERDVPDVFGGRGPERDWKAAKGHADPERVTLEVDPPLGHDLADEIAVAVLNRGQDLRGKLRGLGAYRLAGVASSRA